MKKILILIGLSAALMLKTTSCSKDFLNTVPTDAETIEALTGNFDAARSLLVGVNRTRFINSTHIATGTASFGEGAFIDFLEYLGDDMFDLGETSQTGFWARQALHTRMDNSAMTAIPWNMMYEWIRPLNELLAITEDVNATVAEQAWLRAQALAYRAHFFHMLVRMYGPAIHHSPDALGIVLILEPGVISGIPRATVAESYAQIEADLLEALDLMEQPGVAAVAAAHDRTFISTRVMQGILSRVYLDMHNWTEAARFANLAGNDVLMSRAEFADGFYTRNSEWMWASFVPNDEGTMFHSQPSKRTHTANMYPGAWGYAININRQLVAHTDSANDVRIGGLMVNFLGFPLSNAKFHWAAAGGPYDIVYMRNAEMMLNEAEALLMANTDIARARTLVQSIINARINDGGAFAATLNAMGRDELLAEMKMQRRLEFWGEGHRWFDLKRRGETMDRRTTGANQAVMWPNSLLVDNPRSRYWVWYIPVREVNVNAAIVQNPLEQWGW